MESLPLREFVEDLLYDDQSPEAVVGRLQKQQRKLPTVSKDSIYRYIKSPYGRRIEYHRNKRKKRRRQRPPRSTSWANKRSIDTRPQVIVERKRVGDGEGDFIVSGKSGCGVLLVIVDRKLRAPFLEKILKPTLKNVTAACMRIKKRYPEWLTMTTDNDLLWQHHEALEKELGIIIYFCHPYSSWEKGSVENRNQLIRKDIPKSSDISRYSKKFIRKLEEKLQRRILKCLNYLTPAEALQRYRKQKQRRSAGKRRRERKS